MLLHIYTALVSLLFGTVIPTSFNILMEMFLLPCFTVFLLYRKPYYASIKAYNSTVQEFCAVQLRHYGCVGARHFQSQLRKYIRWKAGILRKKASGFWEQSQSTPVTQIEVTLTDLLHTYVRYSLVATQALSIFDGPRTTMRIRAQNKNGVQQRGSMWVWLLVVHYITIFW